MAVTFFIVLRLSLLRLATLPKNCSLPLRQWITFFDCFFLYLPFHDYPILLLYSPHVTTTIKVFVDPTTHDVTENNLPNLQLSTVWHVFFSVVMYSTRNIVSVIRCMNVWTLNFIYLVYKRYIKWTYNVTSRRVRVAIFVMERQQRVFRPKNHIFSALFNIIICFLAGSTIYFFTLSHKWHDFGKKLWNIRVNIFCFDCLYKILWNFFFL